jgi:cytoskeletal protein RodZ
MDNVGEFLRQVREKQGLSLQDVASKTRIKLDYLQALETNDLSRFPGEVFAKGFMRAYVNCLGLRSGEVLDHFSQAAQAYYHKPEETGQHGAAAADPAASEATKEAMFRWILVGLLVIALLFFIATRENPKDPTTGPSDEEAGTTADEQVGDEPLRGEPASQVVPELRQKKAAETVAINVPGQPSASSESAATLTLTVETLETTWMAIRMDGGEIREALLQPGERVSWKAREQFHVSLGNAGGVRFFLNGRPLQPLGHRGAVVKDVPINRQTTVQPPPPSSEPVTSPQAP